MYHLTALWMIACAACYVVGYRRGATRLRRQLRGDVARLESGR